MTKETVITTNRTLGQGKFFNLKGHWSREAILNYCASKDVKCEEANHLTVTAEYVRNVDVFNGKSKETDHVGEALGR